MNKDSMNKTVLAISLIAAVSSVAVYAYVKAKKKANRKNIPMNFV